MAVTAGNLTNATSKYTLAAQTLIWKEVQARLVLRVDAEDEEKNPRKKRLAGLGVSQLMTDEASGGFESRRRSIIETITFHPPAFKRKESNVGQRFDAMLLSNQEDMKQVRSLRIQAERE